MQQQTTETTTVQSAPTTVQSGNTTVETGGTTVETGGTTVQTEPTTLHDFTLGLLTDLDAREAFQQDPLGCLEAAGLSDITAADVQDILPLVLDAASVPNVDAIDDVLGGHELPAVDSLLQIAGNAEGVTGVADVAGIAAPSALTALVSDVPGLSDFSGLGDVSGTLDSVVSTVPAVPAVPQATDVVSNVSDLAHDNITKVTDVADVHGVTDVLVKDLDTDVLVKDVVDSHALVKDVADVDHVVNVTDNAVEEVAHVSEIHTDLHDNVGQVIGNAVEITGIDALGGGVGNHNDVDIHF